MEVNVFILTDEWDDSRDRNIIRYCGTSGELGPVEVIITNFHPVFFVNRSTSPDKIKIPHLRKKVNMKNFEGDDVDAVYFKTQRDLRKSSELLDAVNVPTYESDVDPSRRFLMEKGINAGMKISGEYVKKNNLAVFTNPVITAAEVNPSFVIVSLDIETGLKNTLLYSIAVHKTGKNGEEKKVFVIGDGTEVASDYIQFLNSEPELLKAFIDWFKLADPDIIIGWHVVGFDLVFLEEKCREHNIVFDIGRYHGKVSLRVKKGGGNFASIPGRVVIDGPPALRAGFYSFEDFKLETVAQELLKTGKIITPDQDKIEEIERLFIENKAKLAEYNLNDTILVTDIFKKSGLVELSVKRSQLSGLLINRLGMMTAAFDHFFLPRLHKSGYVAPNVKDLYTAEHAAGGYVFDPEPGIYNDVIVLDFKSLYPSIILTFRIDPLSRIKSEENPVVTPAGYSFSSTYNYLPGFIETLMKQRADARKKGDKYLAQAIKILMNSFYGVMGSYGCRFYHPSLPSAITGTGQWLLLRSKEFLEKQDYKVIYGDTDSLFVLLKPGEGANHKNTGEQVALSLNRYWDDRLKKDYNVKSALEIEYEKYYRKFIITPARGSESGAKKRYAGLKTESGEERIEFVGMEFVRSDWTRLAKEFQVELYTRVFNKSEIINWIRSVVADVNAGVYDNKLVYRKRIRKDVDDYKNVPPQVRAAKMLNKSEGVVQYVITKQGPVPVELNPSAAGIDYRHYIEKQLKPIADSVLYLLGYSFDDIITAKQLNFFD